MLFFSSSTSVERDIGAGSPVFEYALGGAVRVPVAVGSGDPTVTEERKARSGRVEVNAVVTLSETAALAPAPVFLEAGAASTESIEIAVATISDSALSAPAPVVPVTGVAPLVLYVDALCIVCEP